MLVLLASTESITMKAIVSVIAKIPNRANCVLAIIWSYAFMPLLISLQPVVYALVSITSVYVKLIRVERIHRAINIYIANFLRSNFLLIPSLDGKTMLLLTSRVAESSLSKIDRVLFKFSVIREI